MLLRLASEDDMNADYILKLASWSEPKEVQTKYGPKMLSKAAVTEEFSDAWKAHKDEIKAIGAGFSKNFEGKWELNWWQPLSDELKAARAKSIEDSKSSQADIELPKPDGLEYMPFQKAGIRYALARKNVLIADEMGLGKTIQAIGIVNSDQAIDSVLVICPKSLKLNWQREFEKWQTRGLTIATANGSWPGTQVVILNYESLGKYEQQIMARQWGACIVDEAHYIKNSRAQRSKYVKAIKATRKIRLTGTPIVNRPIELYNIIEDMNDGWGKFFSFAKRYANAHHNGYGWDFSGAANLDELQRRLRETIMVRRLKADVLTELPRKIRQVVEVEADSAAQRHAVEREQKYEKDSEERLADLRARVELSKAESDEAYKAAVDRLNEAQRVDFTEMARLRHETAVAKLPAVIAHVADALDDNDNKIIIAAHHHDVIAALVKDLSDFHPVSLTGENNEQQRLAAVDAFQTDPNVRVFVGSITAAGVGITLTASSHVVFAELDWVPGNISQFEDRAHRIGQTETVLVQHIVLDGSLDARMARMLVSKQAVIDSALDVDHPERTAPVFVPRASAATASATQKSLGIDAERIGIPQRNAIHRALRMLADMDEDFAADLNGVGFSKIDVMVGHSLAACDRLTPRQSALGLKLVKKYRRQIPDDMLKEATCE
jgi:SWI/SNF-related matrix-associated actin-dependent regulator 1 of chromatin subfamily A